ncbi:coiled-coil and C2 domain-containing protein 1-like isoform X1 [Ctenocephalides felis]|uniref:coiled-coil and C2 domain-containing protein 1-like isoform X1 n=1 Tax=Ctenocephalides felis TaxID=7515 RepID=UPI000E6E2A51|nr:coiled-coil and C2 domain-containing protein 1-like isoform X1 [Ctenocephalides felis]
MFGRKKETPKRRNGKGLAQYGLFDIPDPNLDDDAGSDDDENDDDLEAELAAITAGSNPKPKRKPKPKPDPMAVDLDAMIAESMKDIGSDEELSGDDDDPALLNELSKITGEDEGVQEEPENTTPIIPTSDPSTAMVSLLEARLEMYKKAEAIAKGANETSRARRFNRGNKTINDLLKQARAGKSINPEDIPPEVSTGARPEKPAPAENAAPQEEPPATEEPPAPEETPATNELSPTEPTKVEPETDPKIELLTTRKNEYKMAALEAKRSGDSQTAFKYIKIVKQFDLVINALTNGEVVDLRNMPGPPGSDVPSPPKEDNLTQKSADPISPVPIASQEPSPAEEEPEVEEVLIKASSVLEALEQRLEVYKAQMNAATQDNNSSKARRMGRIVKQFEQAIKLHKAGKPIPVDELPTPPGYAPIPINPTGGATAPSAPASSISPRPEPKPAPPVPSTSESQEEETKPKISPKPPARKSGNQTTTSHTEKQAQLLIARQKEFKQAALAAKQKGEIAQAKELLRTAKGFDPLIQAALGGLPVDMKTLPIPNSARSQLEDSFAFVNENDCTEGENDGSDILARLEEQLSRQLKLCLSTRDHHKAMGDVAGTNRFEQLALSVTKDLDVIRLSQRKNLPAPQFHYETKSFNVVQCCTELGDNDLEVTIVKGYNYTVPNPKEVDTYVKIEFPFPQDNPFVEYTPLVKDTNNPDYGATYSIPMQRTSRHCLRVFKRHNLKLDIYAKRSSCWCCFSGFFRSDAVIGTVNVKLQPLETKCVLHDSFQVFDGRKSTGGKLEVKLRVRNPMLTKQVEKLTEKWLIIDH